MFIILQSEASFLTTSNRQKRSFCNKKFLKVRTIKNFIQPFVDLLIHDKSENSL